MNEWNAQFANDPNCNCSVYLDLLEGSEPQGKIVRDNDEELYLGIFDCPTVRIAYRWFVSMREEAETLPIV